jgi:hypothetical protein
LLTHLLRWWIAIAEIIIYAKCVDNLYIVANLIMLHNQCTIEYGVNVGKNKKDKRIWEKYQFFGIVAWRSLIYILRRCLYELTGRPRENFIEIA